MKKELHSLFTSYKADIASLTSAERIRYFLKRHPGKVTFSTSFGAEDQVIAHMIAEIGEPVKIFTLDTGRMFQEVYELLDITRRKYGLPIKIYFPHAGQVEKMVDEKGINLFYDSVANRKLCCHIRKIEPLKRALEGTEIWITGLRREQSVTREDTGPLDWDPDLSIIKVNPLTEWTHEEVWDFIRENHVPYNTLHDKGYPSIGCLPCTRAIQPGEDARAGRWWWEQADLKECGLHVKN